MIKGLFYFSCIFFGLTGTCQQDYAKTILDSLCHERYDGRGYVNNGDVRAADFIESSRKLVQVRLKITRSNNLIH